MATQSGSHGFSTARRVVHAHRHVRVSLSTADADVRDGTVRPSAALMLHRDWSSAANADGSDGRHGDAFAFHLRHSRYDTGAEQDRRRADVMLAVSGRARGRPAPRMRGPVDRRYARQLTEAPRRRRALPEVGWLTPVCANSLLTIFQRSLMRASDR